MRREKRLQSGRSWPAYFIAGVLLCGVCGLAEARRDTGFQSGPPLRRPTAYARVRLAAVQAEPARYPRQPETFEGTLLLQADGTGVIAVGGPPTAVRWSGPADRLIVDRSAAGRRGTTLSWGALLLAMRDTNADGVLDTGSGSAQQAEWQSAMGDIVEGVLARISVVAEPSNRGPAVSIGVVGADDNAIAWPFDRFVLRFSDPVRVAEVARQVRVLVGGAPVAGRIEAFGEAGGFANEFTAIPSAPVALGKALSVALNGLSDPTGKPATMAAGTDVSPDGGSLMGNGGFERDLAGWWTRGTVRVVGVHEGMPPAAGAKQVMVAEGSRLAGYIDVPKTARQLSLSVAGTVEREDPAVVGAWVRLHQSAGTQDNVFVLDAAMLSGRTIPRRVVRYDLTACRGKRVYLEAGTISSNFWETGATLLLDNVTVE